MTLATQSVTWDWLKSISRNLFALDETPLLGTPPSFPWEKFSQECARALSLEGLKITPGELKWREKDILAGIPSPYLTLHLATTGIEGGFSLWMSREDVSLLMGKVLQLSQIVLDVQEEDLVKAFHHFLAIQTISLVQQLDFDKRLSFKITSYEDTPPEAALCQDVKIELGGNRLLARLVLSNEFRKAWAAFYKKQPQSPIEKAKLATIETTVHLEAGRANMRLSDLMQLKNGDLVILDQVLYIPGTEKNKLLLTLDAKPIFVARFKDGSLKILEIPTHHEVYESMVEQVTPPQQKNPAPNPPQDPPPAPQDPPHEAPHDDPPGEHEEENPFAEEEEEEEDIELIKAQAAAIPTLQTTPGAPGAAPTAAPTTAPKPAPTAAPKLAPQPPKPLGPLTTNDIPMQLVVEVGSLIMSAQKLLELAPGNMLDLEISPEQGVNLVVNGRIVGKGELMKIGETVGVRILQIGV